MRPDLPTDSGVKQSMEKVNSTVDILRKTQEDYRTMEKKLEDELLGLEILNKEHVKKFQWWVEAFAGEGLIEGSRD